MLVSKVAFNAIHAGHKLFLRNRKDEPDDTDCLSPKNQTWCRKYLTCGQLCQGKAQPIDHRKDAKHGGACRLIYPGTQGNWEEKKGGRYVAQLTSSYNT